MCVKNSCYEDYLNVEGAKNIKVFGRFSTASRSFRVKMHYKEQLLREKVADLCSK